MQYDHSETIQHIENQLLAEQSKHSKHTEEILEMQNSKLDVCQSKISDIEKNLKADRPVYRETAPEIIVNIPGINDNLLSKFSGRTNDPIGYLHKIKKYFQKQMRNASYRSYSEMEVLHEIVELSFENYASRWWMLVKDSIKTWKEFEEQFTAKYWSVAKQKSIMRRLELERYNERGRQTRSEYAESRIVLLKSMSTEYSDEEIIQKLAEHFDELIQNSVKVQNIRTINDFEELLHKEDSLAEQNLIRAQTNSYNNHTRENTNINKRYHTQTNHSKPHHVTYKTSYVNPYHHHSQQVQPYYKPNHNYNQTHRFHNNKNHVNNSNYNKNFNNKNYQGQNGSHKRFQSPNKEKHNGLFKKYPSREQINLCQVISQGQNGTNPDSRPHTPDRSRDNSQLNC